MATVSEFTLNVIYLIRSIPKGRVATYGQIAALAGKPHGARGVSWILHSSSTSQRLPWHRVIGAKGTISIPVRATSHREQRRRLVAEGVRFDPQGVIDLGKFQWKKKPKRVRAAGPKMFGR